MRLTTSLLAAAALILTLTPAVLADTFRYDYNFQGVIASFETPALITTNTMINRVDFLETNTPSMLSIEIDPISCGNGVPGQSCVSMTFPMITSIFGYGPPIDSVGIFNFGYLGTLSITDLDSIPTAIPEPSGIALLGTGLLGLAGIARRKFIS